jgi:sugar phosphate isomerase/epimerase
MTRTCFRSSTRRTFLRQAAVTFASAGGMAATAPRLSASAPTRMFRNLGPGHIGVAVNQELALQYAVRFGFRGVNAQTADLEKMSSGQRSELVGKMKEQGIRWGVSDLGMQFRAAEEEFLQGLELLRRRTKVLAEVGVSRVGTWISPGHERFTYLQNFELHRKRLREAAIVLGDSGLSLGLEFVGPKTSRDRSRFHFIHTLTELMELIDAIGTGNVGLVLDSYHWFTSHEPMDQVAKLTGRQIVDVHVNDARPGISIDELADLKRALPCSTGVIDMRTFVNSLAKTGYDGPVTCEPFDQQLNEMEDEAALKETAQALNRVFALLES